MTTVDDVLTTLLLALQVEPTVVKELISATSAPAPGVPVGQAWSLSLDAGCSSDPVYPLQVAGSSSHGMFAMQGTNNRGKTTLLLLASILLGVDWNDPIFWEYLENEARYIEAGKRFQSELERGSRSVNLVLTSGSSRFEIHVSDGRAQLKFASEAPITFQVSAVGWAPFQEYVRSRVHCEFIPQKRDYLKQVLRQASMELLRRYKTIEQVLLQRQGTINIATQERDLNGLAEEIADKRERLNVSLGDAALVLDQLELLAQVQARAASEPDLARIARQLALIRTFYSEMADARNDLETINVEVKELEGEYDLLRLDFDAAMPAVRELSGTVQQVMENVKSQSLRTKLAEAQARATVGAWNRLIDDCLVGSPEIYSALARALEELELDKAARSSPTFPIVDELFDRRVTTVGTLHDLLVDYQTWARDVDNLLRQKFDDFRLRVAGVSLDAEDLEQVDDDLRLRERQLQAKKNQIDDLRQGLTTNAKELGRLLDCDADAHYDGVMFKATLREQDLVRDLAGWELGKEPINDALERTGGDPNALWSLGFDAFEEELRQRQREFMAAITSEEKELESLEADLKARRTGLEQRPEFAYARAYSLLEFAHTDLENVLAGPSPENNDIEYLRRLRHPDFHPEDGVDLYTPLTIGLQDLVQERCGRYYAPAGNEWRPLQIVGVDIASETFTVADSDGEQIVNVLSELGTGLRAAMTVRSLATPLPPPTYFTVLLVDEWGDVDQATLGQTLYRDLQALSVPVLGVFTMPSPAQRAVLVDAEAAVLG